MTSFVALQNTVMGIAGLGNDHRSLVKDFVNQARDEIATEARLVIRSAQTITIPDPAHNPADYSLTTDFGLTYLAGIEDIVHTVEGDVNRLESVSLAEMLAYRAAITIPVTGEPSMFYTLHGPDSLMLHPAPAAASTLTLYGTFYPGPMVDDSDAPDELPSQFHGVLVDGALRYAIPLAPLDPRTGSASSRLNAETYDARFQAGKGRVRAWRNKRTSAGPGYVRIGRRVSTVPNSNMVDQGA